MISWKCLFPKFTEGPSLFFPSPISTHPARRASFISFLHTLGTKHKIMYHKKRLCWQGDQHHAFWTNLSQKESDEQGWHNRLQPYDPAIALYYSLCFDDINYSSYGTNRFDIYAILMKGYKDKTIIIYYCVWLQVWRLQCCVYLAFDFLWLA